MVYEFRGAKLIYGVDVACGLHLVDEAAVYSALFSSADML
jgi:hypothetical protein